MRRPGDFNAPRDSRLLAETLTSWDDAVLSGSRRRYLATWPTWPAALWQIDHTFLRGLVPVDARVPRTRASDHAPLVVRCVVRYDPRVTADRGS